MTFSWDTVFSLKVGSFVTVGAGCYSLPFDLYRARPVSGLLALACFGPSYSVFYFQPYQQLSDYYIVLTCIGSVFCLPVSGRRLSVHSPTCGLYRVIALLLFFWPVSGCSVVCQFRAVVSLSFPNVWPVSGH